MAGSEFGLNLESLVIVGDGILKLAALTLGIAPTDVGVDIVGPQAQTKGMTQFTDVAARVIGLTKRGDRCAHHDNRYDHTPFPEYAHHIRCPESLLRIAHSHNAPPQLIPLGRGEGTVRNIIHIPADGVNLPADPGPSHIFLQR